MAIHESQSLSFEMQLARSPAFVKLLAPLLARHHGAQPALAEDNLNRLVRKVRPGLIRVDADELTYPLHVILRFRIERDLIDTFNLAEINDFNQKIADVQHQVRNLARSEEPLRRVSS
jgi:carboxypeptidase Taq